MMPILKVENLSKDFVKSLDLVAKGLNKIGQNYKEEIVHAVDNVNFSIFKGEIVGVVGESGCGKSTLGRMVAGILQPTEGRVEFDSGQVKNKEIPDALLTQMIFQDPMMTLNPVLRVETQMIEAIQAHDNKISREDARIRSRDALGLVGISSADERLRAYPHQFSGGMRQRVSIAIAMLNRPDLIIADEPTTALDVTIQGQVISEMQKLCRETKTALLWITHDLAVIAGIADRVCVMYAGRIIEQGLVANVIANPLHPYTEGLMGSVPSQNQRGKPLQQINGMVPSMLSLPRGCAFQNRCSYVTERCSIERPDITNSSDKRQVRCFNVSGVPKP